VFLHSLQLVLVFAVIGWLVHCRIRLGRRNQQSWNSIVARLQPAWGGRESSCHYLWQEGLSVCPDELWCNIHGARGLWAIFKNAGVMLEIVEFVERNSDGIDVMLLEQLRRDAFQVRKSSIIAIVQSAMTVCSDTVRINAFRTVSMYTGMTARMIRLIEQNAAVALPEFVASM